MRPMKISPPTQAQMAATARSRLRKGLPLIRPPKPMQKALPMPLPEDMCGGSMMTKDEAGAMLRFWGAVGKVAKLEFALVISTYVAGGMRPEIKCFAVLDDGTRSQCRLHCFGGLTTDDFTAVDTYAGWERHDLEKFAEKLSTGFAVRDLLGKEYFTTGLVSSIDEVKIALAARGVDEDVL